MRFLTLLLTLLPLSLFAQQAADIEQAFRHPPEQAKPWVFWYLMRSAYTREGIKADLVAMKEAGIAGAYLAPIKGKTTPPLLEPVIETLTPEWWELMRFVFHEADSLGLQIAMLPNDGFATAGGPWITPELSMQKVVWTTTRVRSGKPLLFNDTLQRPEAYEGYYKDIAVLAFPTPPGGNTSSYSFQPRVSSSLPDAEPQFLAEKGNKRNFSSREPCWIQYTFDEPFTCRSIVIHTNSSNYQSQRLLISVSDDGANFRPVERLTPPRSGWLDWDADITHSIKPVTARYFRFTYSPEGSEPGAEDLDAAKWRPSLKLAGIELLSAARIHQYEGKTGVAWRISERTAPGQVADSLCIPLNSIVDLTGLLKENGQLSWKAPGGDWTILRIGHTSTGHMNETAGATGKGLECDKFNPAAIRFQFRHWFGKALSVAGPELAKRVLTTFHIDSWECGSQNWSPVFREEFRRRRGYDPVKYLPAMAGLPVQNCAVSENFLHDIRKTIAELIADNCFKTLKELAHENGCVFTSETVAPVMTSDGMLHFREVDVPMGEFWLRSPTHDKPNDMLDAISAAHIYGKPIIQAEAFTELRMDWDEHPGMLKTLQDRNYALGTNRLVYHVYTHNPWLDRKPGMTLDAIGLYFQRDQTWWKPGKAWVDYAQRCQALLQLGRPVADIAVFSGEEIPSRAVLPDRLVTTLPGIIGAKRVESEKRRMANTGEPQRVLPKGVTGSANMFDPRAWVDPLRGYAYDSFNPDALLNLAHVNKGRVVFSGGDGYGALVIPEPTQMTPNGSIYSEAVKNRLAVLEAAGAKIIHGRYEGASFESLGIERDIIIRELRDSLTVPETHDIAWTHRRGEGFDIYFIANQSDEEKLLELSLRVSGYTPELWDAVTGSMEEAAEWKSLNGRTLLPVKLAPAGSVFIVFRKKAAPPAINADSKRTNWNTFSFAQPLNGPWEVQFDTAYGGPASPVIFTELQDWSRHTDTRIRHYSGAASYTCTFRVKKPGRRKLWLDLGAIANIATVTVNGTDCGVSWTPPYQVDISKAVRKGKNKLTITVTNTWANRLIGDHTLPPEQRITQTTAPYRLEGAPLLKAGLLGPVSIVELERY